MKKPKISETDLVSIYDSYRNDSLDSFQEKCRSFLINARAPNKEIIDSLDQMTKDQLLKAINNFAFKGHGFGVI